MKLILLSLIFFTSSSFAIDNLQDAPTFNLKGHPKEVSLDKLKGKYVVLEWYNNGCPFVRKHYDSKNIPNMQKKYADKVHWLTINSSAEGKQGFISDVNKAKELYTEEQMSSMALLMDSNGKVGGEYAAKTTPHFFIIDPQGKLVYQGAIDSIASADSNDIKDADNYVAQALDSVIAGKDVAVAKTRPYGCSVKY